jgi:hypothetical protein
MRGAGLLDLGGGVGVEVNAAVIVLLSLEVEGIFLLL